MTTINLGKISITFQGDWAVTTQYKKNDAVRSPYNGSTYVAIIDNIGVAPHTSIDVSWTLSNIGLTDQEKAIFTTLGAGTAQTLAPNQKCVALPIVNGIGGEVATAFLMADNSVRTSGAATANGTLAQNSTPSDMRFDKLNAPSFVPRKVYLTQRQIYCLDTVTGQVASAGHNDYSLGHNDTNNRGIGTMIQFFITNNIKIVDILTSKGWYSNGNSSTYFLTDAGEIYACGYGGYGQLGNGDTADQLQLTKVTGLTGIVGFACSGERTTVFAWNAAGTLWGWGNGQFYVLGNNTTTSYTTPQLLSSYITGVTQVSVTHDYSSAGANPSPFAIARKSDGTVWYAGSNALGQGGFGNAESTGVWRQVPGLSNIEKVYAQAGYYGITAALSSTGYISLCGWGGSYLMGDLGGSRSLFYTPLIGSLPIQGSIIDVKFGGIFSNTSLFMLSSTNRIFMSGYQSSGQNGRGTVSNTGYFQEILGIKGTIAEMVVTTGTDTQITLFVRYTNGAVDALGANNDYKTGANSITTSDLYTLTPVKF